MSEYVATVQDGLRAAYRHTRERHCIRGPTIVARPEARIPGERAGMGPRYHAVTKPGDETTVPMVRPGAYHEGPR